MESFIQVLIYIHAGLGGLALVGGLVALSTQKGGRWHRGGGSVFFWAMSVSALLATMIALLPGHWNPFLFAIGIFTLYLVVSGRLALRYKSMKTSADLQFDKLVSWAMIIIGVGMVGYPAIQILTVGNAGIVLAIFGAIGLSLALRDLRYFKNLERLRQNWLRLHLNKMIGGFIAATTAFFVVNEVLPGLWGWLAPTAVGTIFIAYWTRKVQKGKVFEAK